MTATGDTVGDVLAAQGITLGAPRRGRSRPSTSPVDDGTTIAVRYGRPLAAERRRQTPRRTGSPRPTSRGALDQIGRRFDRRRPVGQPRRAASTRDGLRLDGGHAQAAHVKVGGKQGRARARSRPSPSRDALDATATSSVGKHDIVQPAPAAPRSPTATGSSSPTSASSPSTSTARRSRYGTVTSATTPRWLEGHEHGRPRRARRRCAT